MGSVGVMERRLNQRILIQASAVVTTEDGVRTKMVAVDVSSVGLGVECHTRQRNMITPGGSFVHDGKPVSVVVDLNLPDDALSANIVARCHVVFSRRISSDQCKIGLRYADIGKDDHERLIRFIEKTLQSV